MRAPAPTSATPSETPPGWRNRITGSGEEDPTQLLANPANWRTHPGPQRAALRGALDTVGWVAQVMVNRRTGFVVDGHARVEETISRGEATVPVVYVDLSPEEEALVLATLDPIGAMADRDGSRLEALLAGISVDDAGLRALLGHLAGPKAGQPALQLSAGRTPVGGGATVSADRWGHPLAGARARNPGIGPTLSARVARFFGSCCVNAEPVEPVAPRHVGGEGPGVVEAVTSRGWSPRHTAEPTLSAPQTD